MKLILGFLVFGLFQLIGSAVELVGPVAVSATATGATITWQTDVTAGTRVQVSPNTGAVVIPDSRPDTRHAATLTGLQPGATYSINVGTARVWVGSTTFTTPAIAGASPQPPVSGGKVTPAPVAPTPVARTAAPPARQTWGNFASLQDHFDRHGSDFKAKTPEDYARMAWEFLQRAKAGGLRTKLGDDGVLRVFDPQTRAFAAYNKDGTTKTFFKPDSRDYFERQPGREINLAERK